MEKLDDKKSAAEDVEFESAFGEVLVYFILAQLLAPAQQCRLCVQLPCLPLDELGNHQRVVNGHPRPVGLNEDGTHVNHGA